jgi:tetratricopeptide (TPR) repeat protein
VSPERWSRLRTIVERALEAGGGEGNGSGARQLVEESCVGDGELREAALALLDQDGAATLESPCPGAAAAMVSDLAAAELLGRRFGPYRAIGLIGEGAMGAVYLAVRDDDSFERQVAVKVLKRVVGDVEGRRRFEQERRLLARLDHPGICRLLDGGTTEDGMAYIVMDRVEGVSLHDWCAARADALAESSDPQAARTERRTRVRLFARICDAVACAHAAGVVHRDLKPANIMIAEPRTRTPAEPEPKIIDFGIARVAGSDLTIRGTSERLLGTLPYMAPEQVAGDPADVDARADVYALGVILYEMLSGRQPLNLSDAPLPDAVRRIRDEEPTRLGALHRSLRGELDTIVGKAMEKDPRRRYTSAAELGADIQRWLADRPIAAHRPSAAYRAAKFIRRHRLLVGATCVVILSLTVALAAVGSAFIRAQRQAARVRQVNEFMRGMLAAADPFAPSGGSRVIGAAREGIAAAEMLDGAVAWLDSHLIDDPLVEADIRHSLGVSYSGLGRGESSLVQLRRALVLRETAQGPDALPTLECRNDLATALTRDQRPTESEPIHRACLASYKQLLGPNDQRTLHAAFELAMCIIHLDKYGEAETIAADIAARAPTSGPGGDQLAALASGLQAVAILLSGDDARGQKLADAALSEITRLCGPDQYIAALVTCTLGGCAEGRGDLAEAERRYRDASASYVRLLGDRDPRAASRLLSLGRVLVKEQRYQEAEETLRRAAAIGNQPSPLARQIAEDARVQLAKCQANQTDEGHPSDPAGTSQNIAGPR